jgi:outer membrane receptor protein involved in Fe transport
MSRRLFPLLAALLAAAPALAQDGAVVGRVVDAESDLPLPTASVALWEIAGADSTLVTGVTASIDGDFRLASVPVGTYDVVVSFVGYDDVRQRGVAVGAGETDLGTVGLAPTAEALGEVEVAAERVQVQTRIDRTVYDTADDPVAAGGNATDVLSTLPSVDVDVDGNVSLRGSGNVAVFINGRPAPVQGEFLASYLASLPAGIVERVEVIPNPSAAFEPDGVGGVINIVLKEDAETGLGGTVTAGADTQGGYDATAALTYGRGPWSLAATYGFRNDARAGGGTSFRINRYADDPATLDLDETTTLDQVEVEDRLRRSHLVSLSADYALSRTTTITSQAQVSVQDENEAEVNTALGRSPATAGLFELERLAEEDEAGTSLDARLGLRQSFGEGHRLTLEARGETSEEEEAQFYDEALLRGVFALDPTQRVTEDESERSLTLRADYVRPAFGGTLEAGYQSDWEREASGLLSTSDDGTGAFLPDEDVNNRFEYDEAVHAVYLQGAREWGAWGLQAGARFEVARTTFDLLTTEETFSNDYEALFPSAYLSFAPAQTTTFRAGYSKRINRPRSWSLNPFPSLDDPLNVRQGNPALRPEFVDSFEAGVTQFVPFGSVSLTPYYRRTTDVIRRVAVVRDDGVTVRTSENLDTADAYGAEAVVSLEGVGGLRGFLSLEGYRLQTEGATADAELANDAFGWGGRLNATYDVGDRFGLGGLAVQATARYSAPMDTEQGRIGTRSWMDLALRQSLLDDRASLTLQVRDPFGTAGFAFTLDQPALYQEFERDWGVQQVGLTFSYRFGQQEEARERGERGGGDDYGGEDY